MHRCISFESYIKPQQSQQASSMYPSCISFESYIKPQLAWMMFSVSFRCISFESYIKPQQYLQRRRTSLVVYLLNPTSNHNCFWIFYSFWLLYIFWILHQTTTERPSVLILACCISFESYIKPQHKRVSNHLSKCCISFESYIKPQPLCGFFVLLGVVYLLNPTSNHNVFGFMVFSFALYIFWILHQTTTNRDGYISFPCCISFESYINTLLILM